MNTHLAFTQKKTPPRNPRGGFPWLTPTLAWVFSTVLLTGADLPAQTGTEASPAPPSDPRLRLNFRAAEFDAIWQYLSETAGFIILLEARPQGTLDLVCDQPVTPSEAVSLLNTALQKDGLAAIRNGRRLTVVSRDQAKSRSIPVRLGADTGQIPVTDDIITQIIPVRFIEAGQLVKDLQPLVSSATTIIANESANTIMLTDSQACIHRLAEIIRAIDSSAEELTGVAVFHLTNAQPTEMADLLTQLFPDQSRSQDSQTPFQIGGGFPPPPGMGGGPTGGGPMGGGPMGGGPVPGYSATASQTGNRIRKGNRVLAVPDERTSSLVVSAPKTLLGQIENLLAELDASTAGKRTVGIEQLQHAQVHEIVKVLQDLFQKYTAPATRDASTQTDPLETRSATQTQSQSQPNNRPAARAGNGAVGGFGGGYPTGQQP